MNSARSTRFRPLRWVLMPLLAACILPVVGCVRLLEPLVDDGRHVSGTWTGTLRAVPVSDGLGANYDAAALEIESGPGWPARLSAVPAEMGGGRMPLLVKTWDRPLIVRLADELDVPVGSRVRVRGRMDIDLPRVRQGTAVAGIARHRRDREVAFEHILIVRGPLRVLGPLPK